MHRCYFEEIHSTLKYPNLQINSEPRDNVDYHDLLESLVCVSIALRFS